MDVRRQVMKIPPGMVHIERVRRVIIIMSRRGSMKLNNDQLWEEEVGDKKKEDGSFKSIINFLSYEVS